MTTAKTLRQFADDLATVLPKVDSQTTGQYGDGLGSEDEETQVEALLSALQEERATYEDVIREVPYPDQSATCDLLLREDLPVEAKLLRYWRANGDPEPHMYKHVFSPFNRNTLLTDARRLAQSAFSDKAGLLGLFYRRESNDGNEVQELPERFTAEDLAQKVVQDIDYWYDLDVSVAGISHVDGLQHTVHKAGAVITWEVSELH
ncbi:transcriptional regulator [Haloarcula marina]|uniref:transcriptional regulator n=1 Tax=Haloarcula marina TaxID=2961574 RepID=UPI0020B7E6AE|nr:transcriptional regulator [Halomicroarcula marina]